MLKIFFYGFLIGCILVGIGWYAYGRPDIKQIRQDLNTSNGDFEIVQRDISELSIDSDGFTKDLLAITEGIKKSADRVGSSNERLSKSDGIIGEQLVKMDELGEWHRQSLILGRDLGDVAFDLRRLSEASRETD